MKLFTPRFRLYRPSSRPGVAIHHLEICRRGVGHGRTRSEHWVAPLFPTDDAVRKWAEDAGYSVEVASCCS